MWRINFYQEGNETAIEKHVRSFDTMMELACMDPMIEGVDWKTRSRQEVEDHFVNNTWMIISWIDDHTRVLVEKMEWLIYYHIYGMPVAVEPVRKLRNAWMIGRPDGEGVAAGWSRRSWQKVRRDFLERGKQVVLLGRLDVHNWIEIRRAQY